MFTVIMDLLTQKQSDKSIKFWWSVYYYSHKGNSPEMNKK